MGACVPYEDCDLVIRGGQWFQKILIFVVLGKSLRYNLTWGMVCRSLLIQVNSIGDTVRTWCSDSGASEMKRCHLYCCEAHLQTVGPPTRLGTRVRFIRSESGSTQMSLFVWGWSPTCKSSLRWVLIIKADHACGMLSCLNFLMSNSSGTSYWFARRLFSDPPSRTV